MGKSAKETWDAKYLLLKDKESFASSTSTSFVSFCTILTMVLWSLSLTVPTLFLPGLLYFAILRGSAVASAIVAVLLVSLLLPVKRWPAFVHSRVWKLWREYFDFKVVVPRGLHLHKEHLLLCEFPHSIFPMGQWLSNTLNAKDLGVEEEDWLPATYGVGASATLYVPIMRHLYSWFGMVSASKSLFKKVLERKDRCTAVIVGGIAEMFYSTEHHDMEVVFLKNRKGFVKLALQTGTDIAPVYVLGNTQLWDRVMLGNKFFTDLSRRLKFAFVFPYARWCTPVPYKRPLVWCMGNPIRVERTENPSQEQIDTLHQQFVDALVHTYKEHRHLIAGWENRELVVL